MEAKRHRKGRVQRKFNSRMQATLLFIFIIVILLLMALMVRILKIKYMDGDRYSKRVLHQQSYVSSNIPYKRGDITDRRGTVLATSVKVYNLILDARILLEYDGKKTEENYKDSTLDAISTYFEIDRSELDKIMVEKAESSYVVLKKQISSEKYEEFEVLIKEKDSKIKGVWFEEEYKRKYPYDSLASLVLGFTVSGDIGTYGMEEIYNDELVGINGLSYGYFDQELNLNRVNRSATNGNTVVTTIDASVQQICEEKIQKFIKEYPTNRVSVMVMNPNNGEIYAMASDKTYNLNNPRDLTPFYTKSEIQSMKSDEKLKKLYEIWRNYMVSDSFEPGSTFKPVTVAAALEENVIGYDDTFVCDGSETISGTTLHCSHRSGHGTMNLSQVVEKSCNDALMQIGMKLGKKQFYKYQTNFMFGQKTGIDIPGEANGIIKDLKDISPVDLAASSFGQTCECTIVQLAAAFSSLINGGYYYRPHIMKEIKNDSGAVIQRNDNVLLKETISKDTCEFLKKALYNTVEKGTATAAKVEGYAVGGKTGTAEKHPRGEHKYVLSFIGGVPIDAPKVLIYVVLDEVQDEAKYNQSSLACAFASEILKEILPILEVSPSTDVDYSLWGATIPKDDKKEDSKKKKDVKEETPKMTTMKDDEENFNADVFDESQAGDNGLENYHGSSIENETSEVTPAIDLKNSFED